LAVPIVQGAVLLTESIAKRLDQGYLDATALMEAMMLGGLPQRTAHHKVGALVALAKEQNKSLVELSNEDFHQVDPSFDGDVLRKSLGVEGAVGSYRSYGSSGPAHVAEQISAWKKRL
ncbi:MAG: argininosuccinate lyase, partial [Pirellula sp.]